MNHRFHSETDDSQPPPKSRLRRVLFWLLLLSPAIAIALTIVLGAWHHYHVESAIEAELKKIVDRGEPLTVADLEESYYLPPTADDPTSDWLALLARVRVICDKPEYARLPHFPDGFENKVPPPGTAWPDKPLADDLMRELAPEILELEALAEHASAVRFPLNFEQGSVLIDVSHGNDARQLTRALALRARWQVYQGDRDGALESLILILRVADTMQFEPTIISQMQRYACEGLLVPALVDLMPHAGWSETQLSKLQTELLSATNFADSQRRVLEGERVLGLVVLEDPIAYDPSIAQGSSWTFNAVRLHFLQTTARQIEVSDHSFPQSQTELLAIDDEEFESSRFNRNRLALSWVLLPDASFLNIFAGRAMTSRRIAATLIACQRYRNQTGSWPSGLNNLTPKFIEAVPYDPFDNQPLRYRAAENEIVVYSIGEDLIDDGGASDQQSWWDPDMVFSLKHTGATPK